MQVIGDSLMPNNKDSAVSNPNPIQLNNKILKATQKRKKGRVALAD
jgi:hypothetical protein